MENKRGDIPCVVITPVVPALQRKFSDLQCAGHADWPRQVESGGEYCFRVDVASTEGIASGCGFALAQELFAVVVSPAHPTTFFRNVLCGQRSARLREADAGFNIGLRKAGQLGTERTDRRALRTHEDAVPTDAHMGDDVNYCQANLDDLAQLTCWWSYLPTGDLNVNNVYQSTPLTHAGEATGPGNGQHPYFGTITALVIPDVRS
jgi:hypothetical protein